MIGVEIKQASELLARIIDKDFERHQLPGLLDTYEVRYLLVQGYMAAGENRELLLLTFSPKRKSWSWEPPPGRWERPWSYEQVQSWLRSVERFGLHTISTFDRRTTAAWLYSLWSYWQKPWSEHKTGTGVWLREPPELEQDPLQPFVFKVNRKMLVACALGEGLGMGSEKARAAGEHFPSILSMVNAPAAEWQKVEGVGKKIAGRVYEEIRKEE